MDCMMLPHTQSTSMLYTELTKVSNNKSDLQAHSRSFTIMPFDRPYMISYSFTTVMMSVSTLHHFRDIEAYFSQFKDVT